VALLSDCLWKILYEDPYIIICEKPAGMPSQPDETGDEDLLTCVRKYQETKNDKYPCEVVHRLDRSTGGVILYAKGTSMAGKMSVMFAERKVEKTYLAVVPKMDCSSGRWEDYLLHDRRKNMGKVVCGDVPNAKLAILSFSEQKKNNDYSLMKVKLETGRTHQIRIQFSSRGYPLCGDGKYGSKEKGPLALWACSMSFVHPMNRKELVRVDSEPKNNLFFDRFTN